MKRDLLDSSCENRTKLTGTVSLRTVIKDLLNVPHKLQFYLDIFERSPDGRCGCNMCRGRPPVLHIAL